MTTPRARFHAVVAHSLQAKPFTWIDARQADIPPVEITALAHGLGAEVVRAFGSSPEKSAVLLSRMPVRSVRDTVPPAMRAPGFRSFRRWTIGLGLVLCAFLVPTAVVASVAIMSPRERFFGGSGTSDGDGSTLGVLIGAPVMLTFFGGLIAACFLYYKPAGRTLDQRMSVYMGQFDGSERVRIFAPHFRFPDLMAYTGIAHELGYDLHRRYTLPTFVPDDYYRLYLLSFRRCSCGHGM